MVAASCMFPHPSRKRSFHFIESSSSEDDLLLRESTDSDGNIFCAVDTTRDFDVADYDNSSDTAWQQTMRVNETFRQYLNLCIFGHKL